MTRRARYKRDVALKRCPLPTCRRSGTCLHHTEDDPCHRLHETQESLYNRVADTLDRLTAEARRRDPEGRNLAPEGSPEFERRMKFLYDSLRARDEENSAAEMAELAAKRARQEKPAGTAGG